MAALNPPWVTQASSHPSSLFRQELQAMLGGDPSAVSTGVGGIVTPGSLAVTANGTPNWSVNVAAGGVFIPGGQAASQGSYFGTNDATTNLAVATSDPTNARKDLVIAYVADAQYSGGSNSWALAVVTGTPAASPADPSLAAYPNSVLLARLTIPAAAVSVVSGYITDLRTRASALNAPRFTTSAPGSPTDGDLWADTGKYRLNAYDGSASAWKRISHWRTAGRTGFELSRAANQSVGATSTANVSWDTSVQQYGDTFITVTASTITIPSGLGGLYAVTCSTAGSAAGTASCTLTLTPSSGMWGSAAHVLDGGGGSYRATVSMTMALAAGDTLAARIYNPTGGALNFIGNIVGYRIAS